MALHKSHPTIIARLKRASGHLNAVVAMLEAQKPCVDIAQQLQAVEAAITKAKRELINDHIQHCLEPGHNGEAVTALGELRQIAKFL